MMFDNLTVLLEDVNDEVPYFGSSFTINDVDVMDKFWEKIEWAEHSILHQVIQVKGDGPVLTIAV